MNLTLLRSVKVHWDRGSPPRFRSQRTVALLGYLVAEHRAISREPLAALFWPDEEPAKGKANLHCELHNLAQIPCSGAVFLSPGAVVVSPPEAQIML